MADFDHIPEEVLERAKIMFLGYPNNPTGACATPEYFDKAIAFCREHDILLAHDNAYCDICYDGYEAPSILQRPHAMDCCIEFFSLSKSYNMTGWRIGFACGNPEAIEALGTVKNNLDSGQFTAIQDAAIVALTGPQDCVEEMCALYQKRRDLVVDALRAIGVECEAPKATIYVWAKVPEGETSESFATKLLEEAHVVVTPVTATAPKAKATSASRSPRPTIACSKRSIASSSWCRSRKPVQLVRAFFMPLACAACPANNMHASPTQTAILTASSN